MKPKILFIFGTRPEAIKLAPLIKEFLAEKAFEIEVCNTGQHKELIEPVLEFFDITPTKNLDIMTPDQTLSSLTSELIRRLDSIVWGKNLVIVQGDTTSAFAGALAAFYHKIPVVHIEAGLRSYNKYSPFPEEINRVLISRIAAYHFAPTSSNYIALHQENVLGNKFVVGNTVIDALHMAMEKISSQPRETYLNKFPGVDFSKRIILVTMHRRESFGKPMENVFAALKEIADHNDVEVIYPLHKNPNVRAAAFSSLNGIRNVHLIEPLNYPELIWLMRESSFLITDSGGIQEEAPSLGRKVLVAREDTERNECVDSGFGIMVGTDKNEIIRQATKLLEKKDCTCVPQDVYGKGNASKKIVEIIKSGIMNGSQEN